MVQNFAGTVAKWDVSSSWVSRFLHRHSDELTIKWSAGIDRNRNRADSEHRYRVYFDVLHDKMRERDIQPRNVYNMDEKGFFLGVTNRSKRIFTKAVWASKERRAAVQDGKRKWITLLACVCADGTALPPSLIYEGKGGLQESWIDDIEAEKHEIFCANSDSGWTNNVLGLAWLHQVFERFTKPKARREWRLLILDGHGSHLTIEFFDFCDANKILLMIFPSHATHSLQPLDVVLFSPLSARYSQELDRQSQRQQGLVDLKKGDFFTSFWAAWVATMKPDLITKSFEATGVVPMDANAVMKRFNNHTSEQDEALQTREYGDGDSWKQLSKLYDTAVADMTTVEAKQLKTSFHSLQTQNDLLHFENDGLRAALVTTKKRAKPSSTLQYREPEGSSGRAAFWSPRKLKEAKELRAAKLDQDAQEKLQKAEAREQKAIETTYKKAMADEAKARRKREHEEAKMAREARAKEAAVARALKKQQSDTATTEKITQ